MCDVWKELENGREEFAEDNRFSCIVYSRAKMPSLNDNSECTASENQDSERCPPPNRFSLDGEEHIEPDKPWKNKRLLHGSDDEAESEEYSSAHKKARSSRKDPRLSRDSTASLSQSSSSKILSSKDDGGEEDSF